MRFPGKDPEREQKIQSGWVEKRRKVGNGYLRRGPRRFCINFQLIFMEFAKQTSFLPSKSLQSSLYISKMLLDGGFFSKNPRSAEL